MSTRQRASLASRSKAKRSGVPAEPQGSLNGSVDSPVREGEGFKRFPTNAIRGARVLVVGDVMLDRYWFGEVERISPEAPVPIVRVARREDRLGGAANVARNIVALGAQATLCGTIGADEAGKTLLALARAAGIETCLAQDEKRNTTVKMRVLGRQQQLLRMDFEEAPDGEAVHVLHNAIRPLMAEHDVVVLSDYAKGTLSKVRQLIAMACKAGKPVMIDPKGSDYARYRGATAMTPNRAELMQAVGHWQSEADLQERAQALRAKLRLTALLLTRSEQGMTLFTDHGSEHLPAHAQEVFDVSGAGDTVLATLAVMHAAGLSWSAAAQWANRAGGIVVGKLGTSIVTAEELT